MVLKFYLMTNWLSLRIDAAGVNNNIRYEPNVSNFYGVGVSYDGFGLRLPAIGKYGEESEQEYGKTDYSDFQAFYYGTSFCVDFIYQKYKGFYLDFPEEYGYEPGDPATIRGDIAVRTVGVNLYYQFSRALSLRAAFEQIGRQASSGGSFMVMLGLQQQEISADSDIVPPPVAVLAGIPYSGGRYYLGTLAFGYGYGWIRGKWYVTPVVLFGAGVNRASDERGDQTQHRYDIVTKTTGKLAAGYNGDSFFCGLTFVMDAVQYFSDKSDKAESAPTNSLGEDRNSIGVAVESGYLELFAGFRF